MSELPLLGRFYNRELLLELYEQALQDIPNGLKILNLYGRGGIGKTRLMGELSSRTRGDEYLKARIDLESRYLRRQNDALAILRYGLVKQGVRFDRFDIAQAVIWQHDNPLLTITRERFPAVENSRVLTDILDNALTTPVFGVALQLIDMWGKAIKDKNRHRLVESDDTLRAFDEMPPRERQDALVKLFTQDIADFRSQRNRSARNRRSERNLVVFVDGYEELVPDPSPWGSSALEAAWLRDLLLGLAPALVVVASREPLSWDSYGVPWPSVVHKEQLSALNMSDSTALLEERNVPDQAQRGKLAEAAGGVPYYLHLAADLELRAPGSGEKVRDSSEIYRRFFSFSSGDEMRLLQILSLADTFDEDMYSWILREFPRLDGVIEWEDLIQRQSLVAPLEHPGWYRLHPLVPGGLDRKLEGHSLRRTHTVLWNFWQHRYEHGEHDDIWSTAGMRAFHHALRAGVDSPDTAVQLVEQSIAQGGVTALESLLADVDDHRAAMTSSSNGRHDELLHELAPWLDLELRLLRDSARDAADTTAGLTFRPQNSLARRRALAAAHARRIAGETQAALSAYESVWASSEGASRPRAGFCLADIRMWRGDYKGSMELIETILAGCGPQEALLAADLHRLSALGLRFLYQLPEAESRLGVADGAYHAIGAHYGLAHIRTNRVEMLAHTNPAQAVTEAPAALDAHRMTGLVREVGKVHTAVALANVRMGRLDDAEAALVRADEALDRASYRSGKARNLLIRAFVLRQRGHSPEALDALCQVAAEFRATEVYPDLALLTGRAIRRIGAVPGHILQAEEWARTMFHPVESFTDWSERVESLVVELTRQV
ncbi:hypothetical protein PV342_29285 [Streptomyces sp. PA03-3a]|nr:hypothetical protein [Streptomyces sp. PA03-3a]